MIGEAEQWYKFTRGRQGWKVGKAGRSVDELYPNRLQKWPDNAYNVETVERAYS